MHARPEAPPVMIVNKKIAKGEAPCWPAWPIQIVVKRDDYASAQAPYLFHTMRYLNGKYWIPMHENLAGGDTRVRVYKSADGRSWELKKDETAGVGWAGGMAHYKESLWIATSKGCILSSSDDGASWGPSQYYSDYLLYDMDTVSDTANIVCLALKNDAKVYMLAGSNPMALAPSLIEGAGVTGLAGNVLWGGKGNFFAALRNNLPIYRSSDGTTWNNTNSFSSTGNVSLHVGKDGNALACDTTDFYRFGTSWSVYTPTEDDLVFGSLAYNQSRQKHYALLRDAYSKYWLCSSTNLSSWTKIKALPDTLYKPSTSKNGSSVVAASGGDTYVYASPDLGHIGMLELDAA